MRAFIAVVTTVALGAGAFVLAGEQEQQGGKVARAAPRFTVWEVTITDNAFTPADLPNVKEGDQVLFINAGGDNHTATSDDIKTASPKETFNTGKMLPGQRTGFFLNKSREYLYHCEYHTMNGKITVSAP